MSPIFDEATLNKSEQIFKQKGKTIMAKSTKSSLPKSVRIGSPAPDAGQNTSFWNLKEKTEMVVLANTNEFVSVDQYAMWGINPAPIWLDIGEDDPGVELGLKPSYRAFVPVQVKVDGEEQVKIWSLPITVHRQLEEISEMVDGLKGAVIRGNRTGTGKNTKYTLVPTGKKIDVSDIEVPSPMDIVNGLGPSDRDEIIALIEERTGKTFAQLLGKESEEDEEL